MPLFSAIAFSTTFLTSALTTAGLSAAAAGAASNLIVGTTLTVLSSKLFAPTVRQASPNYSSVLNQEIGPRLRGYGRTLLGGTRAEFRVKSGNLYQVVMIHSGQIDEIEAVYIGDKRAVLNSGGWATNSSFSPGGDEYIRIRTRLGRDDQDAFGGLSAAFPGIWDADHQFKGIACLFGQFRSANASRFSRIYPEGYATPLRALSRLTKCYDPRTGETVWTDNPALCIRDYLISRDGYRLEAEDIDDASFAAFADVCDEPVAKKGGGTERRYRMGGVYSLQDDPKDVLGRMRATCDGELYETPEGLVAIRGGVFEVPTVTITEADILSYDLQQGSDKFQTFNELKITYTSAIRDKYQPDEATRWIDAADQARRGVISSEFNVDMVQDASQARRLAKIYRAKENPAWQGSISTNLKGLRARYARFIRIVMPTLGIDGSFLVESHGINTDLTGCTIDVRALSSSAYSWNAEIEEDSEEPIYDEEDDEPTISPAVIGKDYTIFDFEGGAEEAGKDTSVADFQPVITNAISTGERIVFPKWQYPVRSMATASTGVDIDSDTPVTIDCASGAQFIAGECFVGISGAMFRFKAATQPVSHTSNLVPFSWSGGEISGEQLTATHGMGSGSGLSFIDLTWYTVPVIERVRFLAGFTSPSGANPGFGYIDTGIDTHGVVSGRVRDCLFMGFYDAAIYLSGTRDRRTLAADPFSFTNGSPTITVAAPAHGLSVNQSAWFQGATAAAGLTIYGQYLVTSVATNSFAINAGAIASASTTGGGSAVLMTTELSDMVSYRLAGSDVEVASSRFYRNSVGITAKRNQIGISVIGNTFFENVNSITSAEIDEPNSYGKGWTITNNRIEKSQGGAITLVGGHGDVVSGNLILDWGKTIASGGEDFTPVASGNRIAGINIRSCRAPHIHDNTLLQRGAWAAGTPDANKEPVGIQCRADAELAWIRGTHRASIHHNEIEGAWYSFFETAESDTGDNRYYGNGEQQVGAPRVLQPTSHLTLPRYTSFTPVITVTGGSVSHDFAGGEYWVFENLLTAYGYCDLSGVSSPTGVVRINMPGLPDCEFGLNGAVTITTNNITPRDGYGNIQGQIKSGQNFVELYDQNMTTGVLALLPASTLTANSRISFSVNYRIAP